MCLKNICYCIDSSHNATYEANYQVNMQGNPVFMMLSNSSLYIQSTHVLKKKRQKVKQDIKRHIGLLSYLNTVLLSQPITLNDFALFDFKIMN